MEDAEERSVMSATGLNRIYARSASLEQQVAWRARPRKRMAEKGRQDAVSNVSDVEDCVKHRHVRSVRTKESNKHDWHSKRYDVTFVEA